MDQTIENSESLASSTHGNETEIAEGKNELGDRVGEIEGGIGENLPEAVSSSINRNEDFIELVKGKDYFVVDQEGEKAVGELKAIGAEMKQLLEDYDREKAEIEGADNTKLTENIVQEVPILSDKAEKATIADSSQQRAQEVAQRYQNLTETERNRLGFVKYQVEKGEIGGPNDAPRGEKEVADQIDSADLIETSSAKEVVQDKKTWESVGTKNSLVETLRQAGYQIQNEKDLPAIVKNSATTLQSDKEKSLVVPEEKLVLIDKLRQENSRELDNLLSLGYRIEFMPLAKEKEDILSFLIFLIKLEISKARAGGGKEKTAKPKYLMLVKPEFYFRFGGKEAQAVQNIAREINAEVATIPESESEAVVGKINQLEDGRLLLPSGVEETKSLLSDYVGEENIIEAPITETLEAGSLKSLETQTGGNNER